MKRFFCLLLALFLPLTALADVPSQVQAPDHLTLDPIVTNTGNTVITIDAEVVVPQLEGMNIYPTYSRHLTKEDILTVCDFLGIDGSAFRLSDDSDCPYPDGLYEWGELKTSGYYVYLNNTMWQGVPYGGHLSADHLNPAYEYGNSQYRATTTPFLPDESMETCAYSRAEAEETATGLAAAIAPGLTLETKGIRGGSHWMYGWSEAELKAESERTKDIPVPMAYCFTFSRQVDGLFLSSVSWSGSLLPFYESFRPNVKDEWLSIVISNEGMTSMAYWDPAEVGDPIETDVALLPFERILEVAETILPLKYMSLESPVSKDGRSLSSYYDGRKEATYNIDRITLGYMRVLAKDDMTKFHIVPVWDFWGSGQNRLHHAGGDEDDWTDWFDIDEADCQLTIDARTGLIIDRDYGY